MPKNNYTGESYDVTSRGTNSQGNSYDHRVSESGGHGYHYSNRDGSYYYSNTDGSKYYNCGDGYARYTPSGGSTSTQSGKK
ncbi:hypothetical protein LXA43DRAFT_985176 [Ganoderma leucocontextum]|nr:hypothetical protein LXA43DRAFT_985176 [Ganoderma leucocontextum]